MCVSRLCSVIQGIRGENGGRWHTIESADGGSIRSAVRVPPRACDRIFSV